MAISDPVVLEYNAKREMWWLSRDIETFYDEKRCLREWATREEAIAWCRQTFGVDPLLERPKRGRWGAWR